MLVAPVVHPVDPATNLATESIWLPKGEWIEWPTGKHFTGPVALSRSFSISQTPVYLRAGAIVPMQPPMQYTGQKPVDPLILNVWPLTDGQSSTYAVYADASKGENYKRGVYSLTPVTAAEHGDTLTVEIAPEEGSYPGMIASRGYELRLPADWPPESVTANGRPLKWSYEGNTLTTVIHVPSQPVTEAVRIEVRRVAGSLAARAELDGFAGATARLRSAYDTLNQEWPFTWSPDPLIDTWQTGDRLSYHPETARAEMTGFAAKYTAAQASIQQIDDSIANLSDDQLTRQLMKGRGADTDKQRALAYKAALERALALLKDGKPGSTE
jgi:alpha-glucosidase